MNIVLDESVSYSLKEILIIEKNSVIAVAETSTSGMTDEDIFKIVTKNKASLITRDHHFTNPIRFPPNKTGGIIYIRHGNLSTMQEIELVKRFLKNHSHEEFSGKLVTLYKNSVKIR